MSYLTRLKEQTVPRLSEQDAVDRVKALLGAFDVRGPLHLDRSGRVTRPPSSEPVQWHVTITDPGSTTFEGYLSPDGSSIFLRRGAERDSTGGLFPKPLVDAHHEKRVRRWMEGIGSKEPTRLASLTVNEKGMGRAYFPILRNGYPFVSHPDYGYDLRFSVASGAFLRLSALQNPPPVAPGGPKLDKAAALAALKHIWDAEVAPEEIRVQGARRVWYDLKGDPELGYYLPRGQQTAILAWKIPFHSFRDVGRAIQGGSDGMLIDAVTGRRIRTETVP